MRRTGGPGWLAGLVVLGVVTFAVACGPSSTVLGAEGPGGGSPAPDGRRILMSRCAVCHSLDLVVQQRLDRAHWESVLGKMRRWGAHLDGDEQGALLDYLAHHYHPEAGDQAGEAEISSGRPTSVGPSPIALPAGVATRGKTFYAKNCLPCHGEKGGGGVGPKLAGNSILADLPRFGDTVANGRGGMPAWGGVLSPQEIADIRAWLLDLR